MTYAEISPEDRLCLLLAPADVQPWALDRAAALLNGPLHWGSILGNVMREGVFPLFFHNLRRFGLPVPADVRAQLATAFKVNAIRNASLTQELARVLRVLGDAGIPAIPLKGVALSESLYGDTAMRVCGDLDILVPGGLVATTFRELLRHGYESALPLRTLLRVPLGNAIEYGLTRSDGPINFRLELHWGLFCTSRNDERAATEIWLDSRPGTVFGVSANQLTFDWEFLYLAAHAARHPFERARPRGGVKWLADLHDALSLRAPDWELIRGAARRHGWEPALRWSLRTCHSLLGTVVPRDFAQPASHRMFAHFADALPQFPGHPFSILLILRRLKGGRNKLSFLLRRALLPNFSDYSAVRLPHFLGFLYYLFRPFRLAWSGGRKFLPRRRGARSC